MDKRRSASGLEDEEQPAKEPVADPATGRVRLMAKRCTTCIFRPGNQMFLKPGRVKEMVEACVRDEGHVTCHKTLPVTGTELPGAVCRGWEQHPLAVRSLVVRWMRITGQATLVHEDGRLEDVDYRALPPYVEK